ncbi:hypothetical protein K461DRAFT_275413 [Myriangium duriaei CBS 260.36]|uniref:Uncharacterized protein n=1 Tax=Myriangium duriaei CBS 260.36 TaxID=1168546 RepID=A0A9P4J7H0_9PEZI|nr:hypothetical protein K461DRAFT_275413 [Myriangium duriaei CBS 260.36]
MATHDNPDEELSDYSDVEIESCSEPDVEEGQRMTDEEVKDWLTNTYRHSSNNL